MNLSQVPFFELWQPSVFITSLALQGTYFVLVTGPVHRRFWPGANVSRKQMAAFISGCWILFFAFGSPVDYLSDHDLFSVHMVQHLLEIMLMTPLLLIGTPHWLLPTFDGRNALARAMRAWAHPVVSALVFNAVFSLAHTPLVYNAVLANDGVHFAEHAAFFVAALFMWRPLMLSLPSLPRLTHGGRLLYLLFNFNLMMPVVVILLVSQHAVYGLYANAPRVVPLSPVADIQLGAILMMLGMGVPYLILAVLSYTRQSEAIWYA